MSSSTAFKFIEAKFLTRPGALPFHLIWLPNFLQELLVSASQMLGLQVADTPSQVSYECWGVWTPISMFVQQTLDPLSCVPSPQSVKYIYNLLSPFSVLIYGC